MEKKTVDEKISDALNIEPTIESEIISIESQPQPQADGHLEADYTSVRENLKQIIEKGSIAIDGILSVASEGDSPRAYEVVAQLIKSVSDANKDLIDLHKKIKDINFVSDGPKTQVTNNSIFVGSTKELQDLVKRNVKQIEALQEDE